MKLAIVSIHLLLWLSTAMAQSNSSEMTSDDQYDVEGLIEQQPNSDSDTNSDTLPDHGLLNAIRLLRKQPGRSSLISPNRTGNNQQIMHRVLFSNHSNDSQSIERRRRWRARYARRLQYPYLLDRTSIVHTQQIDDSEFNFKVAGGCVVFIALCIVLTCLR